MSPIFTFVYKSTISFLLQFIHVDWFGFWAEEYTYSWGAVQQIQKKLQFQRFEINAALGMKAVFSKWKQWRIMSFTLLRNVL